MKKILSIAIASTFAAITLAQGTTAVFAKENSCTTDNCVIHTYNIINALGGECKINEIILNYLNSKNKYNSCIDLEKLEEAFSDCKTNGCISHLFGGNCSGNGKPDNDNSDNEKPEIQFPGTNLPELDLPDSIFPDDDSSDENTPDVDIPEEEAPDVDSPEDAPSIPEIDEKPEIDVPEVDIPNTPPSAPDNNNKPESPDNNGSQDDNNADAPSIGGQHSSYVSSIIELVNIEREKNGLSKLSATNSALSKAALKRAEEQAISFSHTRPDGSQWSTVLSEYGVSYSSAGENVAYGQSSPSEVMNAWMNSKGHRENILSGNFTEIGVGVYYKNGTYYWSQLFIS